MCAPVFHPVSAGVLQRLERRETARLYCVQHSCELRHIPPACVTSGKRRKVLAFGLPSHATICTKQRQTATAELAVSDSQCLVNFLLNLERR
jgi:hypothetical protein